MTKVALLIGVSDYEPGLTPLPSAVRDVEAMRQVLAHPEMGGFAEADITVLPNPDRQTMEDAIYTLFANRQKDDLVLLYFSGHGIVDDGGEFYFASRSARKDQGRLVPPTAVAAGSVQGWMQQSRSQRQVIILDSCFSGAFAKGVSAKDSGSVNVEQFLGGRGRAILTAATSTQYAFAHEGFDLSVYTHYLVEGIRTGGADLDDDGFITVAELHDYASSKVKEAAPAMTPEFYPVKEGYQILLAKSPKDDPNLKYRKQVKLVAQEDEGDFSFVNRAYLDDFQQSLGLSPDITIAIETEELEPYRQRRAKVDRYRTVFDGAIAHRYPLTDRDRAALQRLQQLLSLRDEDIEVIEAPILTIQQVEYEQEQAAARQTEEQRRQIDQQRQIEQQRQVEQQREQAAKKEQQKAAQKQRQQEQAAQRTQPISPPPTLSSSSTITRQQFLKWTAFGGGGLAVALLGNQMIQSQKTPEVPLNQGKSGNSASPQLLTSNFETVTVDDQGKIVKRVPAQAKFFQEDLGNEATLDMVAIPAGEFLMGTADTERDTIIQEWTRYGVSQENAAQRTAWETPQHRVKVPEFWMGKFAVTQAQWRQVAGLPKVKVDLNPDPSNFKGAKRPVERVSWEQAVEFCGRLSVKTGKTYRLPSEAEWEYACRAGTTTPFYFGETITSDLVNCAGTNPYGNAPKGEYRQQTTEVGIFPPNGFGLYDMHGNVWEWCADPWHDNYQDAPTDGSVWTTNGNNEIRVLRGGSWATYPVNCRSAYRYSDFPRATFDLTGFRVVCSSPRTLT